MRLVHIIADQLAVLRERAAPVTVAENCNIAWGLARLRLRHAPMLDVVTLTAKTQLEAAHRRSKLLSGGPVHP